MFYINLHFKNKDKTVETIWEIVTFNLSTWQKKIVLGIYEKKAHTILATFVSVVAREVHIRWCSKNCIRY